jgi:hypothetical protein
LSEAAVDAGLVAGVVACVCGFKASKGSVHLLSIKPVLLLEILTTLHGGSGSERRERGEESKEDNGCRYSG